MINNKKCTTHYINIIHKLLHEIKESRLALKIRIFSKVPPPKIPKNAI